MCLFILFAPFYWGPQGRGPLLVHRGVHTFSSPSKLGPWGPGGWLGTSPSLGGVLGKVAGDELADQDVVLAVGLSVGSMMARPG